MRHFVHWSAFAALLVLTGATTTSAQNASVNAPRGAVASIKVQDGAQAAHPARPRSASATDAAQASGEPAPIPYRDDASLEHWYQERGDIAFPTTARLPFCHAYGCALRAIVRISDDDLTELRGIFAPRGHSAEAERDAINLAVSWFEKRAQPLLGGPPDVRGSDLAHSGLAGQTDCLDEATNTTTLLIFLQKEGLLRYHRVERPTSRGGLLITLAHATAVLSDRDGKEWAVDSWMRDMGDPNDVLPLTEWETHLF